MPDRQRRRERCGLYEYGLFILEYRPLAFITEDGGFAPYLFRFLIPAAEREQA